MFERFKKSGSNETGEPLAEPFKDFVPADDLKQPWEPVDGDRVVLAGRHALMLVGADGIQDSGLWYEVQFARWAVDTKRLTVVWIQPEREPMVVTTESDNPKRLMQAVSARVSKTIVATRSFFTATGVRVSASVRRRVDGELFSTLIADGPMTEDDRIKADEIERTLREDLGVED